MIVSDARLPFFVQRGYDATLTCIVLDDDGTAITPSAATLDVYLNGALIESPTTTAGATNSATLAAASTEDKVLGRITARWTLTIAGVTTVVVRDGLLCLSVLYPVIDDESMSAPDYNGADALYARTGLTSFEKWRVQAWEAIERWLLTNKRRPSMILNSWALADLHVAWTLEKLTGYLWGTSNDPYWRERNAVHKAERVAAQEDTLGAIEYDANADGILNDPPPVGGVLWLNGPPERTAC